MSKQTSTPCIILANQHYTVATEITLKHLHVYPHYKIDNFDNS